MKSFKNIAKSMENDTEKTPEQKVLEFEADLRIKNMFDFYTLRKSSLFADSFPRVCIDGSN